MGDIVERKPTASPTFDGHLGIDQPERLFHYTSMTGLLGIICDSELWATKVQYMNDATEFELALNLAEERISALEKTAKTEEIREKIANLFPRRKGVANINLFVSCFCENGDLLSQWRGYSGDGNGYALGLKTSVLVWHAQKKLFEIGKCIYDPNIQREIVDELIFNSLDAPSEDERAVAFERGLLRVGAFFKDKTFEEENEWRIVSPVTSIRDEEVRFRTGKSMLVPYYCMPIGQGDKSAISEAIIGPCPHEELSNSALVMLLIQQGIKLASDRPGGRVIEVKNSKIPFRNW